MLVNQIMTVKKKISPNGPMNNDGKKGTGDQLQRNNMTVKYTFERTKEDVDNLHEVKGIFEFYLHKTYNADAKMYRDFPKLTAILEKKVQDLDVANEQMTAKLEQLEDLRSSVCRILEICKDGNDIPI